MSGLRLRICLAVISAAWGAGCTDSIGAVVSTDAGDDTPMKDGGSVDNNGGNGDNNNGEIDAGPACESGFTRRAGECVDMDECANANSCDANATCTNTQGSFTCTCASGYAGDGKTCADVDECQQAGACTSPVAICTNTDGSFSCACPPGYIGDPSTCTDKNECVTNNGGCGDALYVACTNNPGADPSCTDIDNCLLNNGGCGNGNAEYATCTDNDKAAPTCTDVDACATDNGKCGDDRYATCVDNDKAGPTCVDINNCADDNGGCVAPNYVCTDNDKVAPTCSDPGNPCLTNNGGCTAFQTCVNNLGMASCSDFNECLVDNGNCGEVGRATCTNNDNAAPTCGDIDECLTDNGGCGDDTKFDCVNKIRVPPECVDLDLCGTNNGGCGDAAFNRCSYDAQGAVVCSDINECLTDNGGCGDVTNMTCVNGANARNTCSDVDECATPGLNDCPADKPCINVKGSYVCGCDYPNIFDPTDNVCRPARVLVLDDLGGTNLLADLQAAGFSATGGGLYYKWNQSPNLSNFDTVLWLEGKNFGNPLVPGVDQLLVDFVASGGGLVRTGWGLWWSAVQRNQGYAVNPLSVGIMPVGLLSSALYNLDGGTWTILEPSSPLVTGVPITTFSSTGGYAIYNPLPGSGIIATTVDARVPDPVPVLSYTAVHGGITVHVNDSLLYPTTTRVMEPEIKRIYLNAVHLSAQRVKR